MRVRRTVFDVAVLLVTSVFYCRIFLQENFPVTHDIHWNQFSIMTAAKFYLRTEGVFLPRWSHLTWCGVPYLRFYTPLSYALYGMFFWLSPIQTMRLLYPAIIFLTAVSMYWVSSSLFRDRNVGLVCSTSYNFFGYHILNSHLRGDSAELLAYMILPLTFHFLHLSFYSSNRRKRSSCAVLAGVTVALIILSNVLIGLLTLIWLLPALVLISLFRRKGEYPLLALGTLVSSLGLSAFFLVPALSEKHLILEDEIARGGANEPFLVLRNLMDPSHFFVRTGWRGLAGYPTTPDWSMYLGLVILGLALLSVLFLVSEGDSKIRSMMMYCVFLVVGTLFFSSVYSLPIYEFLVGLDNLVSDLVVNLQFAWRMISICGLAAAVLAGYSFKRFSSYVDRADLRVLASMFIVVLIVMDMAPLTSGLEQADFGLSPEERGALSWLEDQPGIFRVYFSEYGIHSTQRMSLRWRVPASGWVFMDLDGGYGYWRTDRANVTITDALNELNGAGKLRAAGYLSVRYVVIQSRELPEWRGVPRIRVVYKEGSVVVLRNDFFRPYAEVMPDLLDNCHRRVVDCKIHCDLFHSERMTFTVDSPIDGYFVIKETYYPAWTATVDGNPVEVFETDGGLIGIAMTKGQHEVEFRFGHTVSELVGWMITGTTLILFVILMRKRWKLERSHKLILPD